MKRSFFKSYNILNSNYEKAIRENENNIIEKNNLNSIIEKIKFEKEEEFKEIMFKIEDNYKKKFDSNLQNIELKYKQIELHKIDSQLDLKKIQEDSLIIS